MSKNFELLSRLGEQARLAIPAVRVAESLITVPEPPVSVPEPPVAVVEPPAVVAALAIPARPRRVVQAAPGSEEIIKLVQRVFLVPGQDALKSVVFCGVEQRDDSSLFCALTGEILAANMPGRVCLIDADLDSPSLHQRYGFENRLGIADAVLTPDAAPAVARQIDASNLWVIPAGSRAAARQVALSADRFRNRILDQGEKFDRVLIVAPPINLHSDAILYGQLVDGLILVVKASSTRRATAMRAKESLEASNVRLLGAILSDRTFPIPEALYRKF